MKLLSTISPMLLDESEVILTVTKKGDQLNILVQPKLLNGKPETDDETLANLQVAFQLPMAITVMADPDPDAALAEALAGLGAERKPAVTELVSYREKLQNVLADAKKAETEKAEKAAAKAAAKPAASGKKKDKPGKTTTKGASLRRTAPRRKPPPPPCLVLVKRPPFRRLPRSRTCSPTRERRHEYRRSHRRSTQDRRNDADPPVQNGRHRPSRPGPDCTGREDHRNVRARIPPPAQRHHR